MIMHIRDIYAKTEGFRRLFFQSHLARLEKLGLVFGDTWEDIGWEGAWHDTYRNKCGRDTDVIHCTLRLSTRTLGLRLEALPTPHVFTGGPIILLCYKCLAKDGHEFDGNGVEDRLADWLMFGDKM